MTVHSVRKFILAVGLLAISCAFAQETTDKRIDPAKIKDAIDYAKTNKAFADASAANLNVNAPPKAVAGSDPVAVKEIVDLEMKLQDVYNKEFLTKPAAPLKFYANSPDLTLFDIATPGEYHGADVKKYFEFIGPAFIARLEYKEINVAAKGDVAFVFMKQNYYGKSLDGKPIHWIMRQTDGLMKINGEWKIVHTHFSFPVDLQTLKADVKSAKTPLPWNRPAAKP